MMKPTRAYTTLFWFIVAGLGLAAFGALVAATTLTLAWPRPRVVVTTFPTVPATPTTPDTTGLSSEALAKEGWPTYRNEPRGYQLQYPLYWMSIVYNDANVLFGPTAQTYTNPGGDSRFAVIVDAKTMAQPQTIEGITQRGRDEGKTVRSLTVAEQPAVQLEDHAYINTYVINGDVLYMIAYTKGKGGTAGVDFYQGMIESFTITPPVDTTGWKTYRNTQQGYEIKYPPRLHLRTKTDFKPKNWSTLMHSIPYEHPDPCDFKGSGPDGRGRVLDRLTDFTVHFKVGPLNLKDSVTAEEWDGGNFAKANVQEGKLKISPGYIDQTTIGSLAGYRIHQGVEGCGSYKYYFPLNETNTLVIIRWWITELKEDPAFYGKLPGIITSEEEGAWFNAIFSTFKFTK